MRRFAPLLALLAAAFPSFAQERTLAFQPKVGAIGARVHVPMALAPGSEVRFGSRSVPVLRESDGFSFLVPAGATSSFIEVLAGKRLVARSAVPFVVTGTSLVTAPRLIGLKEAIDVFGYAEPMPEGRKPETTARPVLKLDDEEVLTIGEAPPQMLGPAVTLSDTATAGRMGMGPPGFVITARPPRKKYTVPTPTPP